MGEVSVLEDVRDVVSCEVGDELGGDNTFEDSGVD